MELESELRVELAFRPTALQVLAEDGVKPQGTAER
jgi:hypothetical protein